MLETRAVPTPNTALVATPQGVPVAAELVANKELRGRRLGRSASASA
jgi:hypothetical protein